MDRSIQDRPDELLVEILKHLDISSLRNCEHHTEQHNAATLRNIRNVQVPLQYRRNHGRSRHDPSLETRQPLNNSVLPAWCNSIIDLVAGGPYDDSAPFQQNADAQKFITQR